MDYDVPQLRPAPAQWPSLERIIIDQSFNGGFTLTTTRPDKSQYIAPRHDAAFSDAAALILYMLNQFGETTTDEVLQALASWTAKTTPDPGPTLVSAPPVPAFISPFLGDGTMAVDRAIAELQRIGYVVTFRGLVADPLTSTVARSPAEANTTRFPADAVAMNPAWED